MVLVHIGNDPIGNKLGQFVVRASVPPEPGDADGPTEIDGVLNGCGGDIEGVIEPMGEERPFRGGIWARVRVRRLSSEE
jgi:hypothetical protein